ncbi:MAG: hypothetical protein HY645_02685 [Acidobacteria bacterium]|nr:hypothetical protein [Acidobacteriota bacterium]
MKTKTVHILFLTVGMVICSRSALHSQSAYEIGLEVMRSKPQAPDQYKPTSMEPLISNAIFQLKTRGVKEGDKVVLVTHDHEAFDPVWLEAIKVAIRRMGGIADSITLMPIPRRKGTSLDPQEGRQEVPDSWVPRWVEDAIKQSDVVMFRDYLIYLSYGRGLYWTKQGKKVIVVPSGMPVIAEQLALDNYAKFPPELDFAIQRKVWEVLGPNDKKAKNIRITDPLGTDLTFTYDLDPDWVRKNFPHLDPADASTAQGSQLSRHWLFGGVGYQWSHLGIGLEYSKVVDAKGKIVVNAAHMGPLPVRMTYVIDKGQVVSIEGGGRVGEHYMKIIGQYDEVKYPVGFGEDKRNKGARWLEAFAIGVTPTIVAPDFFDPTWFKQQGSYTLGGGWSDHMRAAGVLHFSIGDVYRGEGLMLGVQPKGVKPVKLNGGHLYFPTVVVDGKKLIDNGRLTVLDDPEIRTLAAKYGDPKNLLDVSEEWRKLVHEEYLNDWPTIRPPGRVDYYWELNEEMDKEAAKIANKN